MSALSKDVLNVRVYTAHDSLSVFRIDEEKIAAAVARHPELAGRVNFTLTRTRSRYGGNPGWSDEDLARFYEEMKDADAFVGYMFPLENLKEVAPELKWIHIIGAGIEHLYPLSWLPADVILTNNRGAHAPKTCEYAVMAILMLGNHIPRLATAQRESRWDGHFVSVVSGDTIVILGAGKQGSAVAHGAKRLGLTTIGVDVDTRERENFDRMVSPEELYEVLPQADCVGVTLPLTDETEKFFGEREFAAMKPEAGFFNISRGKVVDTDALLHALYAGEISGAMLDVFETEPLLADSPLWSAPNLVMTPHMGCDDEKNYIHRTFDIVMYNLGRLLAGEPLENKIDPAKGY